MYMISFVSSKWFLIKKGFRVRKIKKKRTLEGFVADEGK